MNLPYMPSVPAPLPAKRLFDPAVLHSQLRTGSGFTHAPGCINPDTGRQRWEAMVAAMGGARRVMTQTPPAAYKPEMGDYAVPIEVAGTEMGRLYEYLLVSADTSDECPTNAMINAALGREPGYGLTSVLLRQLEKLGLIKMPGWSRRYRTIHIVATGQTLRNEAAREELSLAFGEKAAA